MPCTISVVHPSMALPNMPGQCLMPCISYLSLCATVLAVYGTAHTLPSSLTRANSNAAAHACGTLAMEATGDITASAEVSRLPWTASSLTRTSKKAFWSVPSPPPSFSSGSLSHVARLTLGADVERRRRRVPLRALHGHAALYLRPGALSARAAMNV